MDGQLVGVISACGGFPNINFATPIDLYELTKPLMLGGTTYSDPMPELEAMYLLNNDFKSWEESAATLQASADRRNLALYL